MNDPGDAGDDEADLEGIEADLDQAADLEEEAAIELLRSAKRDLNAIREEPEIDSDRREELRNRLDQRLREVDERDAYDGGLGAAMNPEDDEAP